MTEINRCASCKYFGEEVVREDWDDEGKYFEDGTGFHTCERIKHNENGYSETLWTEAHVVDGSGYYAALRVPGDFGCVKWEKADDTNNAAFAGE